MCVCVCFFVDILVFNKQIFSCERNPYRNYLNILNFFNFFNFLNDLNTSRLVLSCRSVYRESALSQGLRVALFTIRSDTTQKQNRFKTGLTHMTHSSPLRGEPPPVTRHDRREPPPVTRVLGFVAYMFYR